MMGASPLRIGVCAAVCLVLAGGRVVGAEEGDENSERRLEPLVEGTRIRITAPSLQEKPLVGTLVGLETGGVSLKRDRTREVETIPRSAVIRLEVSRGRRGHTLKGALIGLGVGVTGMLVAIAATGGTDGDEDLAAAAVGVVGAGGAAVGALIGATTRTDLWEDARVERLRVTLGPTRGGGVGIRVRLALGR